MRNRLVTIPFKRFCLFCFMILLFAGKVFPQVSPVAGWEEIGEQMIPDDEEDSGPNLINFEELDDLKEHPLNINTVTKEQLERLPFLTDLQIEHLLLYLYASGPMETIYELQLVKDMDRQTIQYLLPFVFAGKVEKAVEYPEFRELIRYGKNECTVRLDLPLYKKDGYRTYPDSVLSAHPNKRYLGDSYYHSVRYAYHYKDRVYWGLNMEKDAGEPFFAGKNKKGYDFYSFYFFLRDFGNLKTLAVGNYRLSFGLGLVIGTDYSLGKSSSIATIGSRSTGIRKHASAGESGYFQGLAASYRLGKFTLSGFYSCRRVDALVENGSITSLKTDGLHRTEKDFEKKNRAVNQLIGLDITASFKDIRWGITIVENFFNKVLKSQSKPYSVFYPQGRYFFNAGLNYSYRRNGFQLTGETAIDKAGNVATLNRLQYSPLPGYQVILLQRSYPKGYQTLLARSVSENSAVRNENGIYIGLEAKPVKYWIFFAYADFFRFPWLRYETDRPSSGFDGLVQATYSPFRSLTMFWLYRYKKKDKNIRDEKTGVKAVLPRYEHKFRYRLGFALPDNLSFRTTVDYVRKRPQGVKASNGLMLDQAVGYCFQQLPVRLNIHYGIFDTDDYSTRITIYERSVLNAFSMPSFEGKGMRFALNLRYDMNRKLTALVKFAYTKYADRKEIGTGPERIGNDRKTDLYLQFRWKFP